MKVLITGASRGIGEEIAKKFIDLHCDVHIPTRNELNLNSDINLKYDNFDIIINNAGINPINNITDISSREVMQVNYFSPLKIIQQCLPHMISNNYGRIINIGSIWSDFSKQGRAAYSASKSALNSLTKSLTAEYAKYNILSNTISPGFILTDLTLRNNTEEQIEKLKNSIPIGRLGYCFEIADLVEFLTVKNTYISGQNIIIDGGFSWTRN